MKKDEAAGGRRMTQEQRDDAHYEAIMIVNELHKTIDYSVYCRLIDLIDMLGLPDETCAVEPPKDAQCIMREQENGWREDRLWSCSACGDERAMDGLPDEYDYNYCINCGAKIIGQEPLKLEVDE